MTYRHTLISNLKYMDEVFHNIAHNYPHPTEQGYSGQDDSTLLKWECVDDRFSTGFGSTYEVPVNDFPKREEVVEITIFGDIWLHVDEISYLDRFASKRESVSDEFIIGRAQFKESLPEVLERVYVNGTINLVGDFSHTASTDIGLDDVLSYLQGLSVFPNYFIFNGAVKTLHDNGKTYTINILKQIDDFCKSNNIKSCCVFTDNRLNQDIDVKEYLEVFSTTTKMLKFSVIEWFTHHVNSLEKNYEIDSNGTDLDKYFSSPDFTMNFNLHSEKSLREYITMFNLADGKDCYKELIYTVIKRFILSELFFLHRECFYISLLYKSVDGGLGAELYDYYFGTQTKPYNLIPCLPWHEQGITIDDTITGYHQTKYGEPHSWNLFKNTGQFIGICLHTDFSEYLWAWQQGHSSSYNEFVCMRPDNPANFLPERVYTDPPSENKAVPPIFPGTCCSSFTISQKNKEEYINKLGNMTPIDIWVTRDNYSASITIRLHTEEDKPDLYQSIEFGKMTSVETDNYIYPLYIGGGSLGLSCDIYVFYPVGGGNKTYLAGNVYDLDMNNICLSNSNILHPTKFYDSSFSNFRILTPEGIWRSVFAHKQNASVVPYPSLGPPPDFAIHLDVYNDSDGRNNDGAYPFLMENKYTIGSQHIKNRNWLCREQVDNKKYDFSSRLDSIRVGLKDSIGHGQYLSYGTIPHCWRSWDKEIPSGEFTYNDKKYLAVPCGWDGRLWDYGWHLDIYNDTWEAEDVVNEFEKYYYKQNARIEDKLVIELGDADV